ncbi:hypothetical protein V8E36_002083 [Tilletia maclaganii]
MDEHRPRKKQRRDDGADPDADSVSDHAADDNAAATAPTGSEAVPFLLDTDAALPDPAKDAQHVAVHNFNHAAPSHGEELHPPAGPRAQHEAQIQDSSEYAHLLLAQVAGGNARLLQAGAEDLHHHHLNLAASDAPPPADPGPAQASSDATAPAEGEPVNADAAGTDAAADAAADHGSTLQEQNEARELSHHRLGDLGLVLVQVQLASEPVRYGLVCQQCQTAVKPNQLAAHLTRKDAHPNFKVKTKRAQAAQKQVAELLDVIKRLIKDEGLDPDQALGGQGSSSLLTFEDFFGDSDRSVARVALPSLRVRTASQCRRCWQIVSSTHKKQHRVQVHPDLAKDQVSFSPVEAQELARNGGVLFKVHSTAGGDVAEEEPAVEAGPSGVSDSQQEEQGASASDERTDLDQDHREALSNVLSAIAAVAPVPDGLTQDLRSAMADAEAATHTSIPPPLPAPLATGADVASHALSAAGSLSVSDPAGSEAALTRTPALSAPSVSEHVDHLSDAPDPSLFTPSQHAAVAATAASAAAAAAIAAESAEK